MGGRIAWHGTEVVHRYQVLFHCQTTDTHPACFAAQYFIPPDGVPFWPQGVKCPPGPSCSK